MYEYKMVQIPPNIQKSKGGNDAAAYLENLVNQYASKGWEFDRVDEIGVVSSPGCFASLFGAKQSVTVYYVITFRREK